MKLTELQEILLLFKTENVTTATIISRLKTLTITRYPHEQGTLQTANFEVVIELE